MIKLNGELSLRFSINGKTVVDLSLQGSDPLDKSDVKNSQVCAGAQHIETLSLKVQVEQMDGKLGLHFKGEKGITLAFNYDGERAELPLQPATRKVVEAGESSTKQIAQQRHTHPATAVDAHAAGHGTQDIAESSTSTHNKQSNEAQSQNSHCKDKSQVSRAYFANFTRSR